MYIYIFETHMEMYIKKIVASIITSEIESLTS